MVDITAVHTAGGDALLLDSQIASFNDPILPTPGDRFGVLSSPWQQAGRASAPLSVLTCPLRPKTTVARLFVFATRQMPL